MLSEVELYIFFNEGVLKLICRFDKCLNQHDDKELNLNNM